MSRFRPSLLILLLVGLSAVTVYAAGKCGGPAARCGMKSASAMQPGCSKDVAKLGRAAVTETRRLGDVTVTATHRRGTTVLTVTSKAGRPNTDSVTATLNGQEVDLRPVGPGRYAFDGRPAGKLAVSVRSLWATETANFTLVPTASACPMASNCPGKAKACACGADCQCKPGAPAADCKCAGKCKCGVKAACGMKAACGTATKTSCGMKAACGTAAKAATAKACGGCAGK